MPDGWAEYILCKEVWHCTPLELNEQDAAKVDLHIAFWNAEQRLKQVNADAQKNASKAKSGRR